MELDEAMDQITHIHRHLNKAYVFRGYAGAVALTIAGAAIALALFQSYFMPPATAKTFILQWAVLGAAIGTLTALRIGYTTAQQGSSTDKHLALTVFLQFIPSMAGGVFITLLFVVFGVGDLGLLPGIWAVLFSTGLFAMRPYLPRYLGYVALFYLVSGVYLLRVSEVGLSLNPWGMGLTFGIGHLLSAYVLQRDVSRYS